MARGGEGSEGGSRNKAASPAAAGGATSQPGSKSSTAADLQATAGLLVTGGKLVGAVSDAAGCCTAGDCHAAHTAVPPPTTLALCRRPSLASPATAATRLPPTRLAAVLRPRCRSQHSASAAWASGCPLAAQPPSRWAGRGEGTGARAPPASRRLPEAGAGLAAVPGGAPGSLAQGGRRCLRAARRSRPPAWQRLQGVGASRRASTLLCRPPPGCLPLQEWGQAVGESLDVAGSDLNRKLEGLGQNLGEAAEELGSSIAGAARRWLRRPRRSTPRQQRVLVG